jgi:diacylglycerol kinase (ATP)
LSIVVFVNPLSRANRRDPQIAERFAERLGGGGRVVAPRSLDELDEEAGRLARDPPSLIGVHGGDGTLHRTVAALLRAFTAVNQKVPPLAILTGGTMNVVAASLGIRAEPERLMDELVADARAGRAPEVVVRRVLKVGDTFGFIFGNGLMANFLEEYYAPGGYGPIRALWILARTFLSAIVWGRYARKIFRRFEGQVWVEGQALPWRALTGVGVATVREVGLGFKLNHRADEDPDRFSVLAIHSGPIRLAADLLPVHQGRGIAPRRAYSAVAQRMVIQPDQPETSYTIDGDLYKARGPIAIDLGPELRFVKPRALSEQ